MLVGVSYEPLTTGVSLDTYLDSEISKLPSDVRVTDRRTVFINSVEARRIMIELDVDNIDINNMVYVFLDGSTIWYVEYVGEIAEFFTNLAVFEQSVNTFRMVR